jgi:hypothetical protein
MTKRIALFGTAAALAASVLFASVASAQQTRGPQPTDKPAQQQQLQGAPGDRDRDRNTGPGDVFQNGPRGSDRDRGPDRDFDRGRGRGPDIQDAQASCSRMAIQEAWRRGAYSAQYENAPRLVDTRRGWELQGRMRLHDRRGYSVVNTSCEVRRNGEAADFDFLR